MHDVIVIGGGPGGLHAATRLARAGVDVLLLEEHATTGQPVHCTGVLAAEAFDEFGLSRDSILNPLSTARFFSPSGLTISHTTATTEALVVDRAVFDQNLHDLARRAGAELRLDARVTAVDVTPDDVTVTTRSARFHGRACVLACGANYSLHRQLGLGMPATYLRTAQLEVPADRPGDVEVYFGNDIAPKGFAWVVPVQRGTRSYARVGLMCEGDAPGYFQRLLARVGDAWGLSVQPDGADDGTSSGLASGLKTRRYVRNDSSYVGSGLQTRPNQKLLPLAPIDRTYGDRVLAVGDAAGLVKATTGGGIYYSLVSADLAASVLAGALRRNSLGASTLARYETLWKDRLGSELTAQLSLRDAAQRMDDDSIDGLFHLAQTNGVMPIVRRTARFNQHRDLIAALFKHPPARRLLFKELVSRLAVLPAR
jgi:digeranylgeranylglycerophospholipid reductase